MAFGSIATRYAQAAFESAKDSGEIDETLEQLALLRQLVRENPDVRQLLQNPVVPVEEKISLLDRALRGSWSSLVRSFLQVVMSFGRIELLDEIIEAFSSEVDTAQGRLRVVVRSARPVPEAVLARLQQSLERRERKEILLKTEVDPALLGGLQVVLDYRVIDGSVRRQLDDLRQQLTTTRVH